MSRVIAIVSTLVCVLVMRSFAQPNLSPTQTPKAGKKSEKKEKASGTPSNPLLAGMKGPQSNEPVTTEIFADNAFFDANKNIGIFGGHVKVTDPRFTLQSERLTVYITKGQNQGLEKAIAEGNVAVVRDRPDPNGGPPTRAVGRSESATYVATTGDVELRGTPRVQEGVNTHIATSPETVMVVNQNGQLTTRGPSRTEIRQEPKTDEGEKKEQKKEAKSASSPKESASP
jgi:lipopolysaccharide transport protein LptA